MGFNWRGFFDGRKGKDILETGEEGGGGTWSSFSDLLAKLAKVVKGEEKDNLRHTPAITLSDDIEHKETARGDQKVYHVTKPEHGPLLVPIGDDADVVVLNEIEDEKERQKLEVTLDNQGDKSAYTYGCQRVIISGTPGAPMKKLRITGKKHPYYVVIRKPNQLNALDIKTDQPVILEYKSPKMGAYDKLLFLKASFYENVSVLGLSGWDDKTWKAFQDKFRKDPKIVTVNNEKKLTINLDALLKFYAENKEFPGIEKDFAVRMRKAVEAAKTNGYTVNFVAKQTLSRELQDQISKRPQPEGHQETRKEREKRYGEFVEKLKEEGYIEMTARDFRINPNIPADERDGIKPDTLANAIWAWAKEQGLTPTYDKVDKDDEFAASLVARLERNAQARTEDFYRAFVDNCITEGKGLRQNEDGSLTLTDPKVLGKAVETEVGPEVRMRTAVASMLCRDPAGKSRTVKDTQGNVLQLRDITKRIAPETVKPEVSAKKTTPATPTAPEVRPVNGYRKLIKDLAEQGGITFQGNGTLILNPNFELKEVVKAGFADKFITELNKYARENGCREITCLKPKPGKGLAKKLYDAFTVRSVAAATIRRGSGTQRPRGNE